LNKAIDAINNSAFTNSLKPINTINDLRDGKLLASIIEKFEVNCGRKSRINKENNYQFIEDWLVSIGNMPYIPNYGNFVKHILKDCRIELISNIFGIVAITMFINRNDLRQTFNVKTLFLLLGEPLIPKICKLLNKSLSYESDEKFAINEQNCRLQKQVEQLNKSIEELTTEMRIKDEEHQKIVDSLNLSLSESKNKVENLENEIDILNKLVQQLLSNSWIH
jgi:hypothetical protein